jgi:hypothetical protein
MFQQNLPEYKEYIRSLCEKHFKICNEHLNISGPPYDTTKTTTPLNEIAAVNITFEEYPKEDIFLLCKDAGKTTMSTIFCLVFIVIWFMIMMSAIFYQLRKLIGEKKVDNRVGKKINGQSTNQSHCDAESCYQPVLQGDLPMRPIIVDSRKRISNDNDSE